MYGKINKQLYLESQMYLELKPHIYKLSVSQIRCHGRILVI